jgi:hypothetical protein
VLQVHPDEIHVFPPDSSLERLIFFLFVWLRCCQRLEVVSTTDGLIGKGFGLFRFEELARLDVVWLTFLRLFALVDREAVILCPVMPVQNLRLSGGVPLDKGAALSTRFEG